MAGRIEGRCPLDEAGRAIRLAFGRRPAGVSDLLFATDYVTRADPEGRFRFEHVPPGLVTIVRSPSHDAAGVRVEVRTGEIATVVLP